MKVLTGFFLVSSLISNVAFASGGCGNCEYKPGPPPIKKHYTLECTAKNSAVTVKMDATTSNESYFSFQNFLITGIDSPISFTKTNYAQETAAYYSQSLKQFPKSLYIADFLYYGKDLSGYAFYRNQNYQINLFSHNGTLSKTLDIVVNNLTNETTETYLDSPCTLTVEDLKQ